MQAFTEAIIEAFWGMRSVHVFALPGGKSVLIALGYMGHRAL
jgi:hypothetical protein